MPSRMVERSRIEMRSVSSYALGPGNGDLAGHDVLDQFALLLRQVLQEFLHLTIRQQVGHIVLEELGEMSGEQSTVAASTTV